MSKINFPQTTGNQTPHAERHTNLVTPSLMVPCWLDTDFERSPDYICKHASENPACTSLVYYINYLAFFMCYLEPEETIFGQIVTGIAICAICYIFIFSLYILANYFAVPNAVMLAEYFNLNGHHFGSTVLTVTGSIPKLISLVTICHVGSNNVSLIIANSFGKVTGLFALSMAIIGFRKHVKLTRNFFLIDAGMLLLGYLYFIVVLFTKHFHDMSAAPKDSVGGDVFLLPHAIVLLIAYCVYIAYYFFKLLIPAIKQWRHINAQERKQRFQPVLESAPFRMHLIRFRQAIDPHRHMEYISRWYFYPTIPIWCFMRLIICVVDLKKPLNDWCKPLTIINIFLSPLFLLDFSMDYAYITHCLVVFSLILAVMTIATTQLNKPPIFHWLFAIHGLIFSSVLYNVISWEFQSLIFQVTEYFFDWTEDIIGLLCLSLFFIASELILCWKFMDNGNYGLAYGLAMGLTILTLYTTLPIIVFNMCIPENFRICITANTYTAHVFLVLMLIIGLMAIIMTGFEIRASISAFFLIMICLFYYYILLSSSETIHPFGTKHHSHYYTDVFEASWA